MDTAEDIARRFADRSSSYTRPLPAREDPTTPTPSQADSTARIQFGLEHNTTTSAPELDSSVPSVKWQSIPTTRSTAGMMGLDRSAVDDEYDDLPLPPPPTNSPALHAGSFSTPVVFAINPGLVSNVSSDASVLPTAGATAAVNETSVVKSATSTLPASMTAQTPSPLLTDQLTLGADKTGAHVTPTPVVVRSTPVMPSSARPDINETAASGSTGPAAIACADGGRRCSDGGKQLANDEVIDALHRCQLGWDAAEMRLKAEQRRTGEEKAARVLLGRHLVAYKIVSGALLLVAITVFIAMLVFL